MRYRLLAIVLACALIAPAGAQQPEEWKGKNLQYFPKDIKREVLIQRMREFSFALAVRCQHCHAGGDGISFDGVDFSSDDKPAKNKARVMLHMTDVINKTMLPKLPSRAEPSVEVNCATCHHGLRLPKSLQTTLFEIVEKDGAAAAMARYKELRADMALGVYNFGQWEINELARRLADAKNTSAAIAILEMNGEYLSEIGRHRLPDRRAVLRARREGQGAGALQDRSGKGAGQRPRQGADRGAGEEVT